MSDPTEDELWNGMKPATLYAERLDLAISISDVKCQIATSLRLHRLAKRYGLQRDRWITHRDVLLIDEPWHYQSGPPAEGQERA